MTMLGSKGTEVFAGDGPMTNGPPYHRLDGNPEGSLPLVVVRREGPEALFAAVHEPYEGRPKIQAVRRLDKRKADGAALIMVRTAEFTDYLMAAFDEGRHTLASAAGEAFTFSDYGYLRIEKGTWRVQGKVDGFRVRAASLPPDSSVAVNGKKERLAVAEGLAAWGKLSQEFPPDAQRGEADSPPQCAAAVHCRFQPEEVHLAAGGEKEVELVLRAVGAGRTGGQFRLVVPEGLAGRAGQDRGRADGRTRGAERAIQGSRRERRP